MLKGMGVRFGMVCRVCNSGIAAGQRFCSTCGTRVSVAPPRFTGPGQEMLAVQRVQRHRQTLGILWCVYGVLRLATGVVAVFVLRTIALQRFGTEVWPFGGDIHSFMPIWLNAVVPVIALFTLVLTLLSLLTGYGLLTGRTWGRTVALVVGVLTLIRLPVGTALGVYTLWVLGPVASRAEYAGLVRRVG